MTVQFDLQTEKIYPEEKIRHRRCMNFPDGLCFSCAERSTALFGFVM